MTDKLTSDNFVLFAMNHYDNPQCHTTQEFEEDMKRFLYLKKLFSRYKTSGELRERLILNHIIVLYNLFGEHTTKMLFFKIEEQYWSTLVTFLIFMERMPDKVEDFGIVTANIRLDETVIQALREI